MCSIDKKKQSHYQTAREAGKCSPAVGPGEELQDGGGVAVAIETNLEDPLGLLMVQPL